MSAICSNAAIPTPATVQPHRRAAPPANGLLALLRVWRTRQRQRHQLARLDDRMLRDIGLDRARALHEAEKPFWVA